MSQSGNIMRHSATSATGGSETVKLDADGCRIVERKVSEAGVWTKREFGLIRLVGEKSPARISYATAIKIIKLKDAGLGGSVRIPELKMETSIGQVVRVELAEEVLDDRSPFTKLPAECVVAVLDGERFELVENSTRAGRAELGEFWLAEVHYRQEGGETCYILDFNKALYATKMKMLDGDEVAVSRYYYGEKIW